MEEGKIGQKMKLLLCDPFLLFVPVFFFSSKNKKEEETKSRLEDRKKEKKAERRWCFGGGVKGTRLDDGGFFQSGLHIKNFFREMLIDEGKNIKYKNGL